MLIAYVSIGSFILLSCVVMVFGPTPHIIDDTDGVDPFYIADFYLDYNV